MMHVRDSLRPLLPAVLGVALALTLAGCGGSSPDASKSASPSVSVSPSPTKPAVPAQPKGKYGVTYHILNWAKYANDPVVRAYKRGTEIYAGSINRGKPMPGFARWQSKKFTRWAMQNMQVARQEHLHVARVEQARVVSSTVTGDRAHLVTCEWVESTNFHRRDGALYQNPKVGWSRRRLGFIHRSSGWIFTQSSTAGWCKAGAPR